MRIHLGVVVGDGVREGVGVGVVEGIMGEGVGKKVW